MRTLFNVGSNRSLTLGLFSIFVVLKVIFLLSYGPIHAPDSDGYVVVADIILGEDQGWRSSAEIDKPWQSATAFRIMGYPAVLAVAKKLTPQYWDWLTVVAQISLSMFATAFLARVGYVWSHKTTWVAYAIATGHALGQGWVLDQCVLTDSFNASFWVIAVSIMVLGILEKRPPTYSRLLMLGTLIFAAFLIREASNVLQVLAWPLVWFWAWSTMNSKKRALLCLIIFAFPMIAGTTAYRGWNFMRTGESFITTAGRTALFFPALRLMELGIDPFANDPLLKDMPHLAMPISSRTPMQHVNDINAYIRQTHGMNTLEIADYSYTMFFRLWRERPIDMARVTLSQVREKQAFLAFMPLEAAIQLRMWARWDTNWRKQNIFMKAGRHISRAFSIVIMLGFVYGVVRALKKRLVPSSAANDRQLKHDWLIILLSIIYFGFTFSHAAVSLEMRYLMPAEPFSAIIPHIVLNTAWASMPGGIFTRVKTFFSRNLKK